MNRAAEDSPVTRLFLVRHAATIANESPEGFLQGREFDEGLTANGRRQAALLAEFLQRFTYSVVYTSPLQRAFETAKPIATAKGLPILVNDGLAECRVGAWAGLDWKVIAQRFPKELNDFRRDPVAYGYPGGENYAGILARVTKTIGNIVSDHCGETVVVVSHSVINRIWLASLLGVTLNRTAVIAQANCCVNTVKYTGGEMQVETVNSAFHLL